MDARCRIELFGGLRVQQGDRVITRFRTQKAAALLAYLACYHQRPHSREELIELLWPESEPEPGRTRLSTELSSLRRQLEPSAGRESTIILASHDTVQLNPDVVTTDVAAFFAALRDSEACEGDAERAQHLVEAVELYRGELLRGLYEEWITAERERLADAYQAALRQLIKCLAAARDFDRALDYAHRAVQADPLREESHRNLMRLYVAMGRPADALRQYQELEGLLREQLEVAPSAATRELAERLREVEPPRRRDTEVSQRKPESQTPKLPVPLTRFFGREEEIARLQELVYPVIPPQSPPSQGGALSGSPPYEGGARGGSHLVTLTGPGGTGKTRLSLEVAGRLREAFQDRVWFVPLADLSDPRLIPGAVRDAMRLPRSPDAEPLEQVIEFLNRIVSLNHRAIDSLGQSPDESMHQSLNRTLLILDNFEQLAAQGAPLVLTLLNRVPALTILVTSRRSLSLPGEREFGVQPLPTPGMGVWEYGSVGVKTPTLPYSHTPTQLMGYASVQLFIDRAQSVKSDFALTDRNAAEVAALCACLEGIPLAIELAAARARTLTPKQMLDAVEKRVQWLADRQRDKTSRHRSLWAAMEWSYRLLAPDLQRFFARLSVFRGGWSLEAAQEVCQEPFALDYLEFLRMHSLVLVEESGAEMRYRMLETIREFAWEQRALGRRDARARRHADYFLALVQEAEKALRGPQQRAWLSRLEAEHDNFRAALAWALESDPERALQIGGALWQFWQIHGHLPEGREYLESALERAGASASKAARMKALTAAFNLAWSQSDYSAARVLQEESLAIAQELGNRRDISVSLNNLGLIAWKQGEYAAARALFEESLTIDREAGDKADIAVVLGNLGALAVDQGDYAAAHAFLQESLTIEREIGNRQGIAITLNGLGLVAQAQRDYAAARAFHHESLTIKRDIGNRQGIANSLHNLGLVAQSQGDYAAASVLYGEALAIRQELEDRLGIAESLEAFANLAAAQSKIQNPKHVLSEAEGSEMERAARLFGAAEALREAIRAPLPPADRAEYERIISVVREGLGEDDFTVAWAQGQAMTLEQAIKYALGEAEDV